MRPKLERGWFRDFAVRATRSADVADALPNAPQHPPEHPGAASGSVPSFSGTVRTLANSQVTEKLYSYGYFHPDEKQTVHTDWSSFSIPSDTSKKARMRHTQRLHHREDFQQPDGKPREHQVTRAMEDLIDPKGRGRAALKGTGSVCSSLGDLRQQSYDEEQAVKRAQCFFEKRHAQRYDSRSNQAIGGKATEDVDIAAIARAGRRCVEEASGAHDRNAQGRHLTIPYFKPYGLGEVVQPRTREENFVTNFDSPGFDERSCLPRYPCFLPQNAVAPWFLDPNLQHERGQEVVMPAHCRLQLELEVQQQRLELSALRDQRLAEHEKEWTEVLQHEKRALEWCEELRKKRDAYLAVCDVLLQQRQHCLKTRERREKFHPPPQFPSRHFADEQKEEREQIIRWKNITQTGARCLYIKRQLKLRDGGLGDLTGAALVKGSGQGSRRSTPKIFPRI